tara:strand:+ start:193 stop:429 length:237 start_codon:yes stop_codon:yes gene_type:complete
MKNLKLNSVEIEEITRLLNKRIDGLTYDSEIREDSLWKGGIMSFGSEDDKKIQQYNIKAIETNEKRINIYKSILTKIK